MKKQTHHIKKLELEMIFSSEEKVFQWNKTASYFSNTEMLPLLNSIFDKYFLATHTYFIDRLEIDVGEIGEKEFGKALLKELEAKLNRIFIDKKKEKSLNDLSTISEKDSWPEIDIQKKEKTDLALEAFFYFIDYGIFPWNYSFQSLSKLEAEIKQEVGLEKLIALPGFQQRLQVLSIRRRIYFQFSHLLWKQICHQSYNNSLQDLYSLQEALSEQLLPLAKNKATHKKNIQGNFEEIIEWIGSEAPANTIDWSLHYIHWTINKASPHVKPAGNLDILKPIIQDLLKKLKAADTTKHLAQALSHLAYLSDTFNKPKDLLKMGQHEEKPGQRKPASEEGSKTDLQEPNIEDYLSEKEAKYTNTEKQQYDKNNIENEFVKDESNTKEAEANSTKKRSEERDPDELQHKQFSETENKYITDSLSQKDQADMINQQILLVDKFSEEKEDKHPDFKKVIKEYYLRNSGLILTWPYLERLFYNTGFCEDKAFKNVRLQQRAVHLLAYVATGKEQCEEHELVLPKFLGGWPLQLPVMKEMVLTEIEKNEANQMLSSLIKNWPILKNTSIEGLRSSFFIREGKLYKEEEQWKLIVEQKTYDMLLDHLPYNLAIIKLPWIDTILKVDWG